MLVPASVCSCGLNHMKGRQKVYKSGVARIVLGIKNLIIVDSALARMRTINSWA